MRNVPRAVFALLLVALLPVSEARAQDPDTAARRAPRLTGAEIDSLVAPIALYPDPLLAQVLVAATFADQIEEAAAFVRANGTDSVDAQGWDVSVRAVAHYPPILNRMAEQSDWTTALGQAYAVQSGDVMDAVQRLRALANAHGNLRSTPQQEVVVRGENIIIAPAEPEVVYVPTYDPWIVYYEPIFYGHHYAKYWSFGVGFHIGPWLGYDCDWIGRRVYHHGWTGGWRGRSRPFIARDPRYAGSGPVAVNPTVLNRTDRVRYKTGDRTPNRTVFWGGTGTGPTVYRGGTGTAGRTSGSTVFPRDLRRQTQGSAGGTSYGGTVRSGNRGTAPVIRGRMPSTGASGGSYGSAPLVRRPTAGASSSGTTYAPSRVRSGGTSTGSRPSAAPATSRPSGRSYGPITRSGRRP
jgi:hypothetical protein